MFEMCIVDVWKMMRMKATFKWTKTRFTNNVILQKWWHAAEESGRVTEKKRERQLERLVFISRTCIQCFGVSNKYGIFVLHWNRYDQSTSLAHVHTTNGKQCGNILYPLPNFYKHLTIRFQILLEHDYEIYHSKSIYPSA